MATAGEKITALAVTLQADLNAARAQLAEFGDAFGRLNLALGTAVTAGELPDVVRKRLTAAEKRAQNAEREWELASDAAGLRLREIRQVVGGSGDLVEDVRALKTRCEGADAAKACGATCPMVQDARRIRDEALRRSAEAESALAERNREIDGLRDAVRHERLIADGLRMDRARLIRVSEDAQALAREWEAAAKKQEAEAASLRAQVATLQDMEADERKSHKAWRHHAEDLEVAIFGDESKRMAPVSEAIAEAQRLRAQVESLRGGAEPEAAGDPVVAKARAFLSRVGELLATKNRDYGNAATDPLRIFSRAPADAGIRVRIDDKLSRIARGAGTKDEDTVADLVGYLALLAAQEPEPVAALPSPSSPKTGRRGKWRCRGCRAEISIERPRELTGDEVENAFGQWRWSGLYQSWIHNCPGDHPPAWADRIGDAPEVTP